MKILKKVLSGIGVGICSLAMAAVISSVGADAAATEFAGSAIAIDYSAQTMTVTTVAADKEVMVAYPTVTVKTNKKTQETTTTVKVPAQWDTYETPATGKAVIDLSHLNVKKDTYVMIKGNNLSTPIMVHFVPSQSGVKLTYDAIADQVSFADSKKNPIEGTTFQYRSASGTWAAYDASKIKLAGYAQQGATVYFRETPTATAAKIATTAEDVGGYNTYTVGHFAGAESKVKITKLANGPKVTVDYNKHTFTIPVGTEYRYDYATTWTPVQLNETGKKALPVSLAKTAAGTFEARVAVNETKKKAASKYTKVEYTDVPDISAMYVKKVSGKDTNTELTDATVGVQDIPTVFVGKSKDVTFEYTSNAKTGALTGLKVSNNTEDKKIQVIAVKDYTKIADVAALDATKVLTTVAAGKTVNIAIKNVSNKYVYVRYASDSKTKTWASYYECVGLGGSAS